MSAVFPDTIWVVVPVYNAERWIEKCVRSIQRQTYTKWKTVLVNDGSTDRSGQICDALVSKDERLMVLHTQNSGAYHARLCGILQVPEDSYCVFCDSDDELNPDALQLLHDEAIRSGAEVVCGGTQRLLRNVVLPMERSAFFMAPRIYDHHDIMSKLYVSCFGGGGYPVGLCGKMYRSKKLRNAMLNLDPLPKCFAEDLNVTLHLLPELDNLSVISQPVYRYRYGGGTSRFMSTFLDDSLLMYHNKLKYAHLCEVDYDVACLVAIELKNIIGSYLLMCEKFSTFPHGSLENEVSYVCDLKETEDAIGRFTADRSGIIGLGDAIRNGDHFLICKLIREEVRKNRMKDYFKQFLIGKSR